MMMRGSELLTFESRTHYYMAGPRVHISASDAHWQNPKNIPTLEPEMDGVLVAIVVPSRYSWTFDIAQFFSTLRVFSI